jgi:hypothetical protein
MVASIGFVSPSKLASLAPPVNWIWDGVLATGMVTMVSSRWKLGKTTLMSTLLARLTGGGTFAGSTFKPMRVGVLSEESPALWEKRNQRLHFNEQNTRFKCLPRRRRFSRQQWSDTILEMAEEKLDVVVLDPLAWFLPAEYENRPTAVTDALEELHLLTDEGTGIYLNVHPSKGREHGDFDVRGTAAIAAFADIVVKLDKPANFVDGERIRRLQIVSRLADTESRLLELSADATDYTVVEEEPAADSFTQGWPVLKSMLEDSRFPLTRKQLLNSWLEDYDKPSKSTTNRWLTRALKEGLIVRGGTGRKKAPFRYALPGTDFKARPAVSAHEQAILDMLGM